MFSRWMFAVLAPLALAVTLGACDNNGVQPGVVQSQGGYRGESGRVIAIRDVSLRNGSSGMNDGTLVGGGVGAAGNCAAIGGNAGSAVLGGVLGAIGGAVAGTAIDQNSTRRGIEVTIRKDDGSTVNIAQRDDGDVQMGDRVIIVYNDRGVAKAVRDTGYRRD